MAAKILLVEPSDEQRRQFLAAIRGAPFEVCRVTATNAEGVELYDSIRPHLVVLRMVSSDLGAAAALDLIYKKNPGARAVVSYDVNSRYLVMTAYSHGALSAIKQPFAMHGVLDKLTYAIAAEHHDGIAGSIVRLEHSIQVRYKTASLLARSKPGFCERLGIAGMDLNTDQELRGRSRLKISLFLPPPTNTRRFVGTVEDTELSKPESWCSYVSLHDVSPADREAIEAFVVKAARKG